MLRSLILIVPLAACSRSSTVCGKGTHDDHGTCRPGTEDAKPHLAAEIERVRKLLGDLQRAFDEAGTRREAAVAREITAALGNALEPLVERERASLVEVGRLDPDLNEGVVTLLSELRVIAELGKDHVDRAKLDEAAIEAHRAQIDALRTPNGSLLSDQGYRFAVGVVLASKDEPDGEHARLVEIGAPLCGEDLGVARPGTNGQCNDQPLVGFLYRDSARPQWAKAGFHIPGSLAPGEPFPLDQVILLDPGGVVDGAVQGFDVAFAETATWARLGALRDRVNAAYDHAEALEHRLR